MIVIYMLFGVYIDSTCEDYTIIWFQWFEGRRFIKIKWRDYTEN